VVLKKCFSSVLQEPELSLRRIAAALLADIAKHTPELAQGVVDAGTVPFTAPLINHADAKLKKDVWSCPITLSTSAGCLNNQSSSAANKGSHEF